MAQIVECSLVLRPWQKKVINKLGRFSCLVVHRRAGKTIIAAVRLIWEALMCKHEYGVYCFYSPTKDQSLQNCGKYLEEHTRHIPGVKYTHLKGCVSSITFAHNRATIFLLSGGKPDNVRGNYIDGCVCDEVSQLPDNLFGSIIMPALADYEGWCMFIGTVNGYDQLYEKYQKGQDPEDPDWFSAKFTVEETGAIKREEIERNRRNQSFEQFEREWMCNFDVGGVNQLLSMEAIEAAVSRDGMYHPTQLESFTKIMGVDIAWEGDDSSVIVKRQGMVMHKPMVFKGMDPATLGERVRYEANSWGADAIFMDRGDGTGVYVSVNHLVGDGVRAKMVHFGSGAEDQRYRNRRTEMYYRMAEWVREIGCIPNDMQLKRELAAQTYGKTPNTDIIFLSSKKDVKEKLKCSPDIADALALTFASSVTKKSVDRMRDPQQAYLQRKQQRHKNSSWA